ncbi:cupin domain-containing protein [Croceibacterium salegens]|nr:cupin domain-containing protein [Croceibacterium salegens]
MGYPDQAVVERTERRTNAPVALSSITVRTKKDLEALRDAWAGTDGNPKILASTAGCEDLSFSGLDIKCVLRGEESSGRNSVHNIVLAPGAEIPAHGLDHGDAYWVVAGGEVELTIGSKTAVLGNAGFGFAPPHTTQAVANRSNAPAEVFVIHLPAGIERGFALAKAKYAESGADTVREAWALLEPLGLKLTDSQPLANDDRVNCQQHRVDRKISTLDDLVALRADWAQLEPIPKLVVDPRECRNIAAMGQEARLLLSPEESRGAASAFCNIIHGGVDVPAHHQPTEEETFIILRGDIRLRIGNQTAERVSPGAFGFAPRFGTHAFTHLGEGESFVFSINTPGGHDRGFEIGLTEGGKPEFPQIIEAHGFTFHGPGH